MLSLLERDNVFIYLKPEPNHNIYNVVLIIYCTFNLFLTVRHGVFFFFIFV